MSHIANKIVAQQKYLYQVFSGTRYKIDVFQRDYRWKREQIDALISDLSSSFLSSYKDQDSFIDIQNYNCYYMGPIVLCEDGDSLSVVDGQQRLTSFTLLFIYLHHKQQDYKFDVSINSTQITELTDYIYVKRGGRKTFVMDVPTRKIVLQKLYDDNIHNIDISFSESNEDDRDSNINLVTCYDDIVHLFPKKLLEREILPIFIEWLLYRVVFVEILAFNKDNAYTIFETMNERGLTLNPTEILKAHILSKIVDEDKREEMNLFWKKRVSEIKFIGGSEGDTPFFRAWFRSKYAGMEDFETIGSRFQTWFKNNQKRIFLNKSDDYYHFVKSDFEYFSSLYMKILNLYQDNDAAENEEFYITGCYPMPYSLMMPLMLAPILATDPEVLIDNKLKIVNKYIDLFINRRSFLGLSINQAYIKRLIFEIVEKIRNNNFEDLQQKLYSSIMEDYYKEFDLFKVMEENNKLHINLSLSQGYSHYALARIWHYFDKSQIFSSLLRSRKRSSLVLRQIFSFDEWSRIFSDEALNSNNVTTMNINCWSLTNYCLFRRDMYEAQQTISLQDRICWLRDQGSFPEFNRNSFPTSPLMFLVERKQILEQTINDIWDPKEILKIP